MLQQCLREIHKHIPEAASWGVLLEYPLYRLRRRIDLVLIARDLLIVVELKVGAKHAELADIHQVEEYALDLRDFHKASHDLRMQPLLCCTELETAEPSCSFNPHNQIQDVITSSADGMTRSVLECYRAVAPTLGSQLSLEKWDGSAYEPVPTIIEAASTIFAGHTVKDISRSNAANLRECSEEVLRLIEEAKNKND